MILIFIIFSICLENITIQKQRRLELKQINYFLETKDVILHDVEVKNNKQDIPYEAIIEIPNINLIKGLSLDKSFNNVDKNLQILEESILPNNELNYLFIAGHSGFGNTAYFNNLPKLKLNNQIFFYYQGIKYIYEISDINYQEKQEILKTNISNNTLTLITCHAKNEQLIITSKLINTEKY